MNKVETRTVPSRLEHLVNLVEPLENPHHPGVGERLRQIRLPRHVKDHADRRLHRVARPLEGAGHGEQGPDEHAHLRLDACEGDAAPAEDAAHHPGGLVRVDGDLGQEHREVLAVPVEGRVRAPRPAHVGAFCFASRISLKEHE